jgi:hypothetical protein
MYGSHEAFGGYKAQCQGKTRWKSEAMARVFLQRLRREVPGNGLQPYRCTYCHRWHVGHV